MVFTMDRNQCSGCAGIRTYSGTCALDIDRFDDAAEYLKKQDIDLLELYDAPDVVKLLSDVENRGKLLYALSTPLPSKTFADGAFELRSATAGGKSVQDVLAPSIHPGTKKPYRWLGDWRRLPPLPDSLREIWMKKLGPKPESKPKELPEHSVDLEELRTMVMKRDAGCGYDEWINTGMSVHNETGGSEDGLALWDEWSRGSSSKYPGADNMRSHWESFGNADNPVTVGFLKHSDVASPDEFPDEDPVPSAEATELASSRSPRPVLVRLSEVKVEPIVWLWPQRFARGKLAIMSGDPGLGPEQA